MSFPTNEADIYLEYGAAKGLKTMTDMFRYFAEPGMNRNKVGDLHEQLLEVRIKNHKISEIERNNKKRIKTPEQWEDSK